MIYDKLTNLTTYRGLHPNIDAAIDYITTHDLSQLKMGVNVLNDGLFYNRMTLNGLSLDTAVFESHKHYLDLHIVIEGTEEIGHQFVVDLNEDVDYNKTDDVWLYKKKVGSVIAQDPTTFALFFPQDAHAPKIEQTGKEIQKVVFKILYN